MRKKKKQTIASRRFKNLLSGDYYTPFVFKLKPRASDIPSFEVVGITVNIKSLQGCRERLLPGFFCGFSKETLLLLKDIPDVEVDRDAGKKEHEIISIKLNDCNGSSFLNRLDSDPAFANKFLQLSFEALRYIYFVCEAGNLSSEARAPRYWQRHLPRLLFLGLRRKTLETKELIFLLNNEMKWIKGQRKSFNPILDSMKTLFEGIVQAFRESVTAEGRIAACEECANLFAMLREEKKYCSPACRQKAKNSRYRTNPKNIEMIKMKDRERQAERRRFYKDHGINK